MTQSYCVVGATRGTGLQIARRLKESQKSVRAIVRDLDKGHTLLGDGVDLRQGDVTDRLSLDAARFGECRAIFFAVDITGGIGGRGFFNPIEDIRAVTYQGLVNTVDSARASGFRGRFVLLSGMGSELPSMAGRVLNWIKGDLQRNQRDRDGYLRRSGLEWCIGRGAVLTDQTGRGRDLRISAPIHRLSPLLRVSRTDFARALILAADHPAAAGRTFDVFNQPGTAPDDGALSAQFEALNTSALRSQP